MYIVILEAIGVFVLFLVILISGDPIGVGMTLTSMIFFSGKLGGGSFNPAISFIMFLLNKIDSAKFRYQILGQFIGFIMIYYFYINITSQQVEVQ